MTVHDNEMMFTKAFVAFCGLKHTRKTVGNAQYITKNDIYV